MRADYEELLRGHMKFCDWAIEWQMNDNVGNNAHGGGKKIVTSHRKQWTQT